MPTASNKVKFQYIGTTAPSTYDGDTIYFDNVNKNIKVGSNVIATNNCDVLEITAVNGYPYGSLNGGTASAIPSEAIYGYWTNGAQVYFKLTSLGQDSTIYLPIRHLYQNYLYFSDVFFNNYQQKLYFGYAILNINNSTITSNFEPLGTNSSSVIEFSVNDTNISLRDGTTSLSYTVTSGTNWGNLYTAAQNGDEIILKYNDSVYCKGRITSYDLDDDEGVIYFYWEGFSCYFKIGYNGSATNQIQIVCGSRNLNNQSF